MLRFQFRIVDLLCAMTALCLFLGLATYGVPFAITTGYDILAVAICIGKTFGRRLGLRSRFWQSRLTVFEWITIVVVAICIHVLAMPALERGHP